MARRRLSDLLREEANKPSEEATAAVEQSADEPDTEEPDGAGEPATIAASSSTKASTAAKSRGTKRTETAEPETTPNPEQDETLLQKIADLTLVLDAQKETIDAQKETIAQLQTDLEQARKDARQLADANATLTQELKTLQAKKEAVDTAALEKQAESRPYQELRLSSPPIAPTSNPPNSFNKDVGWFD